LRALVAPQRAYRDYRHKVDVFEAELREQVNSELSLNDYRSRYAPRMAHEMFDVLMPALLAGMVSVKPLIGRRNQELRAVAAKLQLGTPDDIVVEMGIAMFRLASHLKRADFSDLDELAGRIERREMAPEFLKEWDDFLARFGWRGPLEMDLANARYADDPRLALRQLSFMAVDDQAFNPEAAHRRLAAERQAAYQTLMQRFGPLRRCLLRRFYCLNELFAGTRDTPKHLLILYNYGVRKRALTLGGQLAKQGRLQAAQQVFDLQFEDLRVASQDPNMDLVERCAQRSHFQQKLRRLVSAFPLVIDSRGRILRPAANTGAPGVLSGMAVSSGVVVGTVKVLNSPHEKTVEKGDVIVAYTTDPGWTPLFVNAAAIVLEVGGVLQHGALVAREYAKPCVVGIDRVVETLRDGQRVEVDGDAGTVRLLS
jgi:pyruvate,water dikinase